MEHGGGFSLTLKATASDGWTSSTAPISLVAAPSPRLASNHLYCPCHLFPAGILTDRHHLNLSGMLFLFHFVLESLYCRRVKDHSELGRGIKLCQV